MQGGYVNGKWVQGGTDPDANATRHWYLIDVFVYFSHSLVTLSPLCWTNTAHRRGVKFVLMFENEERFGATMSHMVFGTFITEWDEGRLVRNKLLATMKSAPMNAERLAELAVDLGFDGWLSNYPDLSAVVAGNRKFDVYMGMDVFGRKTFGGGQWNVVDGDLEEFSLLNLPFFSSIMVISFCAKNKGETNVAVDVLKKANVSAAIFAPGCLYETKQPPDFQTARN
ncbi:hypothetical protein NC652_020759 [Populus alba x Populus x berolinensis]|nr:hypothetical protein NC652_020759 [Populus alba x Populus x berolinensis]